LVELGSKVVIASRSQNKIDEAVLELNKHCAPDAQVLGLACDIRNRESVANMMKTTIKEFGAINGLVNNGGGQFHSKGYF
jgi:NADP-dependent 3-hydroxy acid dehydrogenase YdfG